MRFIVITLYLFLAVSASFGEDKTCQDTATRLLVKCNPSGYNSFDREDPCFDPDTRAIKIDGAILGYSYPIPPSRALELWRAIEVLEEFKKEFYPMNLLIKD